MKRRMTFSLEAGRMAFTLVELLVVIAIIAILTGLLLPSINRATEAARSVACRTNLRQLTGAAMLYSQDAGGRLPDRTAWSYDHGWVPIVLAHYLGLPTRPSSREPRVQFDSVMTCASSARYPGPAAWSYNRTMQMNEHLAGSCRWRPERTDTGAAGWDTTSISRRAPLRVQRVPDPSGAAQFFDGIRSRPSGPPGSRYYNTHSNSSEFAVSRRHDMFFTHFRSSLQADQHGPDEMINVVFLDGHARSLYRHETEELSRNWTSRAFWGQ